MTLSNSGKKPGKRPLIQYKVLAAMLYGIVPGVKIVAPGVVVGTYHPLREHLRISQRSLDKALDNMAETGILNILEKSRFTFVVAFTVPRPWRVLDGSNIITEAK